MKVTIAIKKSWGDNAIRGVGTYTRELVAALTSKFSDSSFKISSQPNLIVSDLIHYPYFDPFFITLPSKEKLPTVVTVHDLIPLKYPENFPRGIRGSVKWLIQKRRLNHVHHIVTDSLASKKDIVKLTGISSSKISVVPLAPAGRPDSHTSVSEVKNKYQLPEKYLLYVGDINWNKNIPGLIRAFSQLHDPTLHLVLVGKSFLGSSVIPELTAINKAIKQSQVGERIHKLGYVPSQDLPALYESALLYVQPSWDEGFGLPILEAMSYGCPVATSKQGSLPEVGGKAVAYFDPQKDIANVIKSVLQSPAKRGALAKAGLKQAQKFTWDNTARLTYEIYQKVLAKN